MSDINGAASEAREILAHASGLMRAFEEMAATSAHDTDHRPRVTCPRGRQARGIGDAPARQRSRRAHRPIQADARRRNRFE